MNRHRVSKALLTLALGLTALAATARAEATPAGSRLIRLAPPPPAAPAWNVTLGAFLYMPTAGFQYAVSEHYAVGATAHVFHFNYNGIAYTPIGGYATLHGYSDTGFQGIWCQLGLGAFTGSSTYGIFKESQLAFAALATAGYRFRFDAVTVGVGAGVEYFDLQKKGSIPRSSYLTPISTVDVGIAF